MTLRKRIERHAWAMTGNPDIDEANYVRWWRVWRHFRGWRQHTPDRLAQWRNR